MFALSNDLRDLLRRGAWIGSFGTIFSDRKKKWNSSRGSGALQGESTVRADLEIAEWASYDPPPSCVIWKISG